MFSNKTPTGPIQLRIPLLPHITRGVITKPALRTESHCAPITGEVCNTLGHHLYEALRAEDSHSTSISEEEKKTPAPSLMVTKVDEARERERERERESTALINNFIN